MKRLMKFSLSNRYEVEGCEVIWAIRAGSITSTFVDRGAATFFLPHLNEEKDQKDKPMKRLKYTVDGEQHNKWCINFGTISSHENQILTITTLWALNRPQIGDIFFIFPRKQVFTFF